MKTWKSIKRLVMEEKGISSVEYALLLALIGSAIAAAAVGLGTQVTANITQATSDLGGGA